MKNINNEVSRVGDICNYWNKLVIVHKLDDAGWVEVIKIKNPSKPYEPVGAPFSVRTSQLNLVQSAVPDRGKKAKKKDESIQ